MDKETIALIIAQNGLGTFAAILTTKAAKLQKQLDAATDADKKAAIQKQLTKATKLAAAIKAANDGILEYQALTA